MKRKFNVYFSGSPSGGFSSYPIEYLNRTETTDSNSHKKGTEVSTLKIKNNITTIHYVFYGIGSKRNGKRGGRSFGIWIDIEGYMIPKEEYKNLYHSLKHLFIEGIVHNDDAFLLEQINGNVVYNISSFRENTSMFQRLQNMVERVFWNDFGSKLQEIPPNYNGISINLVPEKYKPNKNTSTSEAKKNSGRGKTDNIDRLKYKFEKLELEVSHLYKDISKLKTIIFSLLAINLIIAIIAIIAIFTPSHSRSKAFIEPPASNPQKAEQTNPDVVNDKEIQPTNIIRKNGKLWFLNQDYFWRFLEQKPDTNIGLNEFYNLLSKFLFNHPTIKSRYNGESNSLISDLKGKNKGDTPKIANLFSSVPAGEIPIDILLPRLKKEIKLSNYIVYRENELLH